MRLPNLKDINQIVSDRQQAIADYEEIRAAVLYFSAQLAKASKHRITNRDLPKLGPCEYLSYHALEYKEPGGCCVSLQLRKLRVYMPYETGWEVVVYHQNGNHGSREVYCLGYNLGGQYYGITLNTWGDLFQIWDKLYEGLKKPAELDREEVQAIWAEYNAAFDKLADLDNKSLKLGVCFTE